ncbi:hypothetical protein ACO0QE_003504 [Hanseniaspora vineae]
MGIENTSIETSSKVGPENELESSSLTYRGAEEDHKNEENSDKGNPFSSSQVIQPDTVADENSLNNKSSDSNEHWTSEGFGSSSRQSISVQTTPTDLHVVVPQSGFTTSSLSPVKADIDLSTTPSAATPTTTTTTTKKTTTTKGLLDTQSAGGLINSMWASLSFATGGSGTPDNSKTDLDSFDQKKSNRVSSISHRKNDSISSYTTIFSGNAPESPIEDRTIKTKEKQAEESVDEPVAYYSETNTLKIPFASSKKNTDFHTTFKSVPADDRLLMDVFTCSLAKDTSNNTSNNNTIKNDGSWLQTKDKTARDRSSSVSQKQTNFAANSSFMKQNSRRDSYTSSSPTTSSYTGFSSSMSALCNGEFFLSENYISFRSNKNILSLWNTNIIIYIHDIELIDNMGKILKNKFRVTSTVLTSSEENSDESNLEPTDAAKSASDSTAVIVKTVYGKTHTFFNFNKPEMISDAINTMWEKQINFKNPLLLTSKEKESDKLLESNKPNNSSGLLVDTFPIDNYYLSNTRSNSNFSPSLANVQPFKKNVFDLEDEILSVDESVDESYDDYHKRVSTDKTSSNGYTTKEKKVEEALETDSDGEEEDDDDEEEEEEEDDDGDEEEEGEKTDGEELELDGSDHVEVFAFKDNDTYNYVGPLFHEETFFLLSPEQEQTEYLLAEVELDAPPGIVFEILFSSTNPKFSLDFLTNQNSSNFDPVHLGNFNEKINQHGQKYREYQYDKGLNYPIGPKSTRCYVRETILSLNYEDYINVLNVTSTPDVPSGSSFNVQTRYMFRWSTGGKSVLKILYWIEWTGGSWIKSMIEKSCKSGQVEATKAFVKLLEETIAEHVTKKNLSLAEATKASSKESNLGDISPLKQKKKKKGTALSDSSTSQSGGIGGIAVATNIAKPAELSGKGQHLLESALSNEQTANINTMGNPASVIAGSVDGAQIMKLIISSSKVLTLLLLAVLILLVLNLYFQYKIMARYNMLHDVLPDFYSNLQNLLLASSSVLPNSVSESFLNKSEGSIKHDDVTQQLLNSIDQLILRRIENGQPA